MSQAGTVNNSGGGPTTDLHVARIIVGIIGQGATHSTIAAGIAAAVTAGGATVYIQDGIYTENLSIPDGVNLTASLNTVGTSIIGVQIIGTLTFNSSSFLFSTISNIRLVTNNAPAIICQGSGTVTIGIAGCFLSVSGGVEGVLYTNSSVNGELYFNNSSGDVSDLNSQLFQMSGAGFIIIDNCNFTNGNLTSSVSTNKSTISSGNLSVYSSELPCAIISSGTANIRYYSNKMDNENTTVPFSNNQTWLTIGSSGTNLVDGCYFNSGTQSSISVSAGSFLSLSNSTVFSSAANAITGLGTISISSCEFTGVSAIINTSGQLPLNTQLGLINGGGTVSQVLTSNGSTAFPTWKSNSGNLVLIQSLSASNSASLTFTSGINSTYTNYVLQYHNYLTTNSAGNLEMQISINSGVSYIASGYQSGIAFIAYNNGTGAFGAANSTTFMFISVAQDTTGVPGAGTLTLYDVTNGSPMTYTGHTITSSTSGTPLALISQVWGNNTAVNVNAFKIFCSAGNISQGTFNLYGIVK